MTEKPAASSGRSPDPSPAKDPSPMGISRYMRILDLFGPDHPSWAVAEISQALGTSASTLYRLLREMVTVGLIEATVESRYRLGPLFIDYYRRLRLTDPLVQAGGRFLEPLIAQSGLPCRAVLARLYGGTVMCVAERSHPHASTGMSYELGLPMPLLRGATSKAVLSTLPKRQMLALTSAALDAPAQEALRGELAQLRKTGFSITAGEVDPGMAGIAAPVQNRALGVYASLSLIVTQDQLTAQSRPHLATAVATTARMIEAFMSELERG